MLQITEDLDMQHDTGVESTSRWIERFKVASEHVLQSGKKIQTSKKKSETTRYTNVHGNRTSFTSRIKKNSAQHYAFLYFCIFRILNLFSVGLQKSLLSDGQLEAHRRPEHLKYFMNCCSLQKHAHASRSHFNIHNHHASTLY